MPTSFLHREVLLWSIGAESPGAVCSNQFLSQEPGTNQEIKKFARDKGFTGLLMDKIDVNGRKASPVYTFLKVRSHCKLCSCNVC